MLYFDPAKGLYPETVEEVRERVSNEWKTAFHKDGETDLDTDPETPAGQLIDSQTAHIVEKDNEILYLANQFNPLSAQGIWQDALGKIYFINRHLAQSSSAVCKCTGLKGTEIPIGAQIRSTVDGTSWLCAEQAKIPASGYIDVTFLCMDTGPIAAAENTLTSIITIIPGWDSVTNENQAVLGRNTESQMEFEQRRFDSVAANARGSVPAIYGSLANIEGVVMCVVLENIYNVSIQKWGVTIPGHSIFISILGGTSSEIAETIYRKKDAGCGTAGNTTVTYTDTSIPGEPVFSYKIQRPHTIDIYIYVTLEYANSLLSNIADLIKQAIYDDFNGSGPHSTTRVGIAQNLYASRFFCCIREAGGSTLKDVKLSLDGGLTWEDMVMIRADQAPVLNIDNITVLIEEIPNDRT